MTGSFSAPRFEAESKLFLKAYFSEGVNFAREKNCAYINVWNINYAMEGVSGQ